MQSFTRSHLSTIIKYIGISFITGAIAHGFFSGTRQILTALFGVICFIIGTVLEGEKNNMKTILLSALLAIAIGAITGGLQHFPDSPERSVWILPIGLILSIPLYGLVHNYEIRGKSRHYAIVVSILTLVLSLALYLTIEKLGLTGHSHEGVAPATIREVEDNTLVPAETDTHSH